MIQISLIPDFVSQANFQLPIFVTQTMSEEQPNNPLHGVKLQTMLEFLVEELGWEELAINININCFKSNPSIKSSLKFLRRAPWARDKVERLYLRVKRTKGN